MADMTDEELYWMGLAAERRVEIKRLQKVIMEALAEIRQGHPIAAALVLSAVLETEK